MMDRDTQWLYQLLASVQLERFYIRMRDGLNVTRIEHLNYVKEADLEQIGISNQVCLVKCVILFDLFVYLKPYSGEYNHLVPLYGLCISKSL